MTSPGMRFKAAPANPGPVALSLENEQQELATLEDVFKQMDVDCNDLINQNEFRSFLKKNPRGWPLADILDGQPEDVKNQIIAFWFRKLDVTNNGSIDKAEFIAFFKAMKETKYKEMIYADFLLNLFDRNFDGKLDKEEYKTMLHVLLGRDVPDYVVRGVSAEGLSRQDLVSLLHSVHCDFTKLDIRNAAKQSEFILIGALVGVAVVAAGLGVAFLRNKNLF